MLLPNGTTTFRHGCWGIDVKFSNFWELKNLVDTIQDGIASGGLYDLEIFIFTDNVVAEGAYYKGNADNCFLFELVLQLMCLEMSGTIKLHVIYVAGECMIIQDTDGLSWSDYTAGVMSGAHMLQFVPLHLSAID